VPRRRWLLIVALLATAVLVTVRVSYVGGGGARLVLPPLGAGGAKFGALGADGDDDGDGNGNGSSAAGVRDERLARTPSEDAEDDHGVGGNEDEQEEEEERGRRLALEPDPDSDAREAALWTQRRAQVVAAVRHAWQGYRTSAWGRDELLPLSRTGADSFHLGLTIIDALDTLWLAGCADEYAEARAWVATSLDVGVDVTVNLFETTIRVLGGLLSAHYLTADAVYLERARDLGDRLLGAFVGSHPGVPMASVNLRARRGERAHFSGGASSTAEVATLQLEFAYLSALTDDDRFRRAADAIIAHMDTLPKQDGLVPVFIR
jgi:hypothetical protein